MVQAIFSFHRMRALCLAGDLAGWRGFVRQYTPLARHLAAHYFPELDADALAVSVFQQARAGDAAFLREFTGTSEGEFLLHFRCFVLRRGRQQRTAQPTALFSPDTFWALLQKFPPLQREMILLSFRRYSLEAINVIHRFELESAEKILTEVLEQAKLLLGPAFRSDLLALDHDALFAQIEQQRTKDCVSDRIYVRIVDGQITWRDKERVESHIDACLYCLARLADYRETFYFYQKLPAAEPALLNRMFTALDLPPEGPAKRRGLMRFLPSLGRRAN